MKKALIIIAGLAFMVTAVWLIGSGISDFGREAVEAEKTESGIKADESRMDKADSEAQSADENPAESSEPGYQYSGNMKTITITESVLQEGNLLLVNPWKEIPDSYKDAGYNTIYKKGASYQIRSTDIKLQDKALEALVEMMDKAKDEGLEHMMVWDGYRTQAKQQKLFDETFAEMKLLMKEEDAKKETAKRVAVPGTSEHQLGLAIDIGLYENGEAVGTSESFGDTEFGKWAKLNCWKFGWVLRYSSDKSDITGIIFEPWHFRYTGIAHAKYMHENDICMEEYFDELKEKQSIIVKDEDGVDRWAVYRFELGSEKTVKVKIPDKGTYEVSGDNTGGFIVTVDLQG